MRIDNLYKCSFESKENWEAVKESINTGDIENPKYPFYSFQEFGHIAIPAVFDEETGEETGPASFHTDWAVDVYSKVLIPELDEYTIEEKKKYHNNVSGGNWNIITKKK